MAGHSEEFKKAVVRKALLPESPGAARVAEEAGISLQTLYKWLRKLRTGQEWRWAELVIRGAGVLRLPLG